MILFDALAAVALIAEPTEDEFPACCCRAIAACAAFEGPPGFAEASLAFADEDDALL